MDCGDTTVYSDRPIPPDIATAIAGARLREQAMPGYRPGEHYRVMLLDDARRYAVFTKLSGRGSNRLALGLSAFGNIFVNMTRVDQFAARNHAGIRHSRSLGVPGGMPYRMYDWHLAVEHLVEVEGYDLPRLAASGLTEDQAHTAMLRWHASRSRERNPAGS